MARTVPVLVQTEASECGLVCVAMILGAYGQSIDLPTLRTRHPMSLKGATLKHVMSIASRSGLVSRPLRADLHEIDELHLPCILHWEFNHFVVLTRVSGDNVTIHDPATGKRVLKREQVSRSFTGVALELSPGPEFKEVEEKRTISLRALTGHITGFKRSLLQLLSLSLAIQVMTVVGPLLTQGIIDHVLVSRDGNLLYLIAIALAFLLVFKSVITLVRSLATIHLSMQLSLQWTGNVLRHLLRLPASYFEKRHLGDITSRMGSVGAIQGFLTTSAISVVLDGLLAITTVVVMFVYSKMLLLVSVLALLVYLAIRLSTYEMFKRANEEQLIRGAKQSSHLLETLRGIQSIRTNAVEDRRHASWLNLAVDTQNQAVYVAKLGMAYGFVNGLVFGLERIAVIVLGALLVMENKFSIGMLVAYLSYREQFSARVSSLVDTLIGWKMLRLHGERLADIVLAEPEERPGLSGQGVIPAEPSIEFREVSFRYGEEEPWVLDRCSFYVEPGASVAISGPSGCGKSTLVKVLLGLLKPTAGKVLVGGVEVTKLGSAALRGMVSSVLQEDHLFAGSIAENVALGFDVRDMDRIIEVCSKAGIHDEIAAMPMGYHTLVGDMGTTLSGGQKQRILLARALYRDPRILVMDEATSHLDVRRERAVSAEIARLKVTRLVIAHRPETLASCDIILSMESGRVVPPSAPGKATGDRPDGAPSPSAIPAVV